MDSSESSIDGSLNPEMNRSADVENSNWESGSSDLSQYQEEISPIRTSQPTLPSDDEGSEADVQRTLDFSSHTVLSSDDERPDMRDPIREDTTALPTKEMDSPLRNCNKLTSYLTTRGYAVAQLEDSDVDPNSE